MLISFPVQGGSLLNSQGTVKGHGSTHLKSLRLDSQVDEEMGDAIIEVFDPAVLHGGEGRVDVFQEHVDGVDIRNVLFSDIFLDLLHDGVLAVFDQVEDVVAGVGKVLQVGLLVFTLLESVLLVLFDDADDFFLLAVKFLSVAVEDDLVTVGLHDGVLVLRHELLDALLRLLDLLQLVFALGEDLVIAFDEFAEQGVLLGADLAKHFDFLIRLLGRHSRSDF